MKEAMLIFLAALFVFIFITVILVKRKKTKDPIPRYVCDTCGELDCICHRVDDNLNE